MKRVGPHLPDGSNKRPRLHEYTMEIPEVTKPAVTAAAPPPKKVVNRFLLLPLSAAGPPCA